jgi:hypothetical protein
MKNVELRIENGELRMENWVHQAWGMEFGEKKHGK